MNLRSWLFVPGDDDKKLSKVDGSGADAILLDLEDSVTPGNRPKARQKVRAVLDARPPGSRKCELWVRINAYDDSALQDLAAIVGGAPDGIMLPKIHGAAEVVRLSHHLEALETREGVPVGHVKIVPVVTETPAGALRLAEFTDLNLPRLAGLSWGAEDLSAAIGATTNLDETGKWSLTYRWVRSAMLLAAKAAGVQAVETLYVDYRDMDGLRAACRSAAQEGFTGRVAIHPAQVAPINESFAPSKEDVELARKIVAAMGDGSSGTVGIDGKMFDIPHLKRAQNLLRMHAHYTRAKGDIA